MNEILTSAYPDQPLARDRWIVARRGPRQPVSADQPYAFLVEQERFATGEVGPVATIFLTNRECPWRCAMCDLWQHTLPGPVPRGAIPRQIEYALSRLPTARQVKLYNSGSFFDPQAVPREDDQAIAALVQHFERVIVESHPSLVSERCARFQQLLGTQLEVAMGLETVHPVALEKLNKRMTVAQFVAAGAWLHAHEIDLRAFALVHPPFVEASEAMHWAQRTIDLAMRSGATATTLIPTRADNGAMGQLALAGAFATPTLRSLEDALDYGLQHNARREAVSTSTHQRVFVDLWDLERFASCMQCSRARLERLRTMNETQTTCEPVYCLQCKGQS